MAKIFLELHIAVNNGASVGSGCGLHPYIAALGERKTYDEAPLLSKLIAELVKSVKPTEQTTTLTIHALFWIHWALFRWMLAPSPQTYREIPEFLRPTSWQLFVIHPMVVDFVHSPRLREFMCEKQLVDMPWVAQACTTIACEWSRPDVDAFCRDGWTRRLVLSPIYKTHAGNAASWTLGPSCRQWLTNADYFCTITTSVHGSEREW